MTSFVGPPKLQDQHLALHRHSAIPLDPTVWHFVDTSKFSSARVRYFHVVRFGQQPESLLRTRSRLNAVTLALEPKKKS